ncbi:MAG: ATP-binding cassette domain-containing protein [bacterium]|nr:ATP-binding cassette domain-containing protein [bacterium]
MGDVAIFGGAAIRLRISIEFTIINVTNALEQTLYISNLIEFFKIKPGISPTKGLEPSSSRGEIELKNVLFTYPGSGDPVLKDISLHIEPGETIALVGENGAGKTTLVKLIARLYETDKGSVLFDGHDVRSLSVAHLHNQLSFVFQSFGRYEGTVRDNIALGDCNELMNNSDRIEEIARLANIHDMINRMPQGYDTMLGRTFGEYTLSRGQWQQIALARAFARESTLLILDEPTSNLDAHTEYELFSRFQKLAEGRTTILITHRFSTVSMAERILVMDQGRIIETGTHRELISLRKHYASLYNLHLSRMAMPS